jgi:hypothetical protein
MHSLMRTEKGQHQENRKAQIIRAEGGDDIAKMVQMNGQQYVMDWLRDNTYGLAEPISY